MSDCLVRLVTSLAEATKHWGKVENGAAGFEMQSPEIGYLANRDCESPHLGSYRVEILKPWLDEVATYTVTVTEEVRRGR